MIDIPKGWFRVPDDDYIRFGDKSYGQSSGEWLDIHAAMCGLPSKGMILIREKTMIKIKGEYAEALVNLDEVELEETAKTQIQDIVNHYTSKGTLIRIMADTHAGYGVPIGFTQTMGDYIIPNLIGVDIACGVSACRIDLPYDDWGLFDQEVRQIPHGFKNRTTVAPQIDGIRLSAEVSRLALQVNYDPQKALLSCGSLGGGNHFIEVDEAPNGDRWLVVHSGSRGIGHAVAMYYQNLAKEFARVINQEPGDLSALPFDWVRHAYHYAEATKVMNRFASMSRYIILQQLAGSDCKIIESVHNYIDDTDGMIRKGAISAKLGERVIIPLNMHDGTIIGTGKGSKKWNYSAPHGAGRVLSRKKAKATLGLEEFKETMKDVWSSCVDKARLDEAPMAYKDQGLILDSLAEIVDVDWIMKPVYNFKA